MKIEPGELQFHETTEEEFRNKIVTGGWIECYNRCPIETCGKVGVHRHYICSACGQIDFANKHTCLECWRMSEIQRIRHKIIAFNRKHGAMLKRLGVSAVVIVLFTIANWRAT